jgi:hypothetical protein
MSTAKESDCFGLKEAAQQLSLRAPGVKFLALGQTVFWDEPMKAGLALAAKDQEVGFVAGIHDTDYFAKMPGHESAENQFRTLPHNDGSTRSLWSAAAEFSAMFGSETVVTKDILLQAGLRFQRLASTRKGFLDEATEAWGWRGIVSLSDQPPITLEVKTDPLIRELCNTLRWAINSSVSFVRGANAEEKGNELNRIFCDIADHPGQNLATVYRKLLDPIYSFVASKPVSLETTQTSELLRFNLQTFAQDRFKLLGRFVESSSRKEACLAYDTAIKGYAGLYELSKFGTGAIPFDLIIPGVGRGTIRLGNHGAVIMTRKPVFLSYKRPIQSLQEFAQLVQAKFGSECVVVGKAVTLIGMLGSEFSFAFHEGASAYVSASRKLHQILNHQVHPILRIRYNTWDSLANVCEWLKLPTPFQSAFGSEEICAPSFAARWSEVVTEQTELLAKLGTLRKPMDLVAYIDQEKGGAWKTQANEYVALQAELASLQKNLRILRAKRQEGYRRIKEIGREWLIVQAAMGEQFRAEIFEKAPSEQSAQAREKFRQQLEELSIEREKLRIAARETGQLQRAAAQDPEIMRAHRRRQEIEMEAELKRLKLIREAVISGKGLMNANRRPSGWWLPLVSPDGTWFNETMKSAECYWEPMN